MAAVEVARTPGRGRLAAGSVQAQSVVNCDESGRPGRASGTGPGLRPGIPCSWMPAPADRDE